MADHLPGLKPRRRPDVVVIPAVFDEGEPVPVDDHDPALTGELVRVLPDRISVFASEPGWQLGGVYIPRRPSTMEWALRREAIMRAVDAAIARARRTGESRVYLSINVTLDLRQQTANVEIEEDGAA